MTKVNFIEALDENNIVSCDKIFKYFYNNSIVGHSITFPTGEIYINEAFCKMLGYSEVEIKNKLWQEITYPDDIYITQKNIDSLISAEKEAVHFIKRYVKKDGSILWSEVYTSLYRDVNNIITFMITIVIDITERIRAEAELKDSKDLYYTFINSSQDLIFLKDMNFRYIIANNALANYYGRNR